MEGLIDEIWNGDYWKRTVETTREGIRERIRRGINNGDSTQAIRDSLLADFSGLFSTKRALTIARTEVTSSLNAGHYLTTQRLAGIEEAAGMVREWVSILDKRLRPTHRKAHGQQVGLTENFMVGGYEARFPGDPNLPARERNRCILPGQYVRGEFIGATKALYDGQAVEIVTLNGRVIRLTSNHPVMTKGGWVAAGKIKKGDSLISYTGKVERRLATGALGSDESCYQNDPVLIEDVFDSFPASHLFKFPNGGSSDFHGDGEFIEGDIDVVWSNGLLSSDDVISRFEFPRKLFLESVLSKTLFLGCLRALYPFLPSMFVFPGAIPGSSTLPLDARAVGFHRFPFKEFRFGSTANIDTHLFESLSKGRSFKSDHFRNLLHGDAAFVKRFSSLQIDLLSRFFTANLRRFIPRPGTHTRPNKGIPDGGVTTSDPLANFAKRQAGLVEFDCVRSIRNFSFAGMFTTSRVLILPMDG